MLNKKIQKHWTGSKGFGLFAIQKIDENEKIWWPTPETIEKIHESRLHSLPSDKREHWIIHSYQIGDHLYIDTDDSTFMNHSCQPNTKDQGDFILAARNISIGEEITWNYLPYVNSLHMFTCLCNSPNCVKIVKKGVYCGNDYVTAVSY